MRKIDIFPYRDGSLAFRRDDCDEFQNVTRLGLGTTADATNPLTAKLNNALWTARYDSEGGDGNLRTKLNKETAADVLSILLQSGYSGRAEIGLIGDDDLAFKVSADGSAWHDAMRVERTSGKVSFPNTASRPVLTANRTYYVRTDGSDGNDGLTNTSGGALQPNDGLPVIRTLRTAVYSWDSRPNTSAAASSST